MKSYSSLLRVLKQETQYQMHLFLEASNLSAGGQHHILKPTDKTGWIQILDEADSVSVRVNALEKGLNPSYRPTAMSN